ncbi:hypothetical protein AcW1_008875 [Taiwanofungus camphoratus]|nr:hypothetical protein AcV7_007121 [Antrodia cinnamomea]KAI0930111.1 hypothetical protein AcV5_006906 [Antrodia cinnamomea]KAI0949188.1 hypothetical protein AcW1_008875 [Antrodia cinnamomea]
MLALNPTASKRVEHHRQKARDRSGYCQHVLVTQPFRRPSAHSISRKVCIAKILTLQSLLLSISSNSQRGTPSNATILQLRRQIVVGFLQIWVQLPTFAVLEWIAVRTVGDAAMSAIVAH